MGGWRISASFPLMKGRLVGTHPWVGGRDQRLLHARARLACLCPCREVKTRSPSLALARDHHGRPLAAVGGQSSLVCGSKAALLHRACAPPCRACTPPSWPSRHRQCLAPLFLAFLMSSFIICTQKRNAVTLPSTWCSAGMQATRVLTMGKPYRNTTMVCRSVP